MVRNLGFFAFQFLLLFNIPLIFLDFIYRKAQTEQIYIEYSDCVDVEIFLQDLRIGYVVVND